MTLRILRMFFKNIWDIIIRFVHQSGNKRSRIQKDSYSRIRGKFCELRIFRVRLEVRRNFLPKLVGEANIFSPTRKMYGKKYLPLMTQKGKLLPNVDTECDSVDIMREYSRESEKRTRKFCTIFTIVWR